MEKLFWCEWCLLAYGEVVYGRSECMTKMNVVNEEEITMNTMKQCEYDYDCYYCDEWLLCVEYTLI